MANLVIPRREIWTQPPQDIVRVSERFASRLKFAIIPNVGLVNLSGLDTPTQSTGMDKLVGKSGVSYLGGKRSEFKATLPNANGLTLISVWRARPTSNYLSGDTTRCLIANRTAGNAGWMWGRVSAVGGGATGNLTAQTYVINGIAQYSESNYTIESNIDTPVACRYSKATGKISWFRFGNKSSPDTTAATSPTVGGNVVFGASGPYSDNGSPWLDVASIVLGFVGELSDSEIYDLTKDVKSVWGAFETRETRLFVPVSSIGGSYTLTAQAGIYSLTGQPAQLLKSKLLTSSGGTYQHVGADASLYRSKQLSLSGGSYSTSGTSADITFTGLAANYLLTAQGGSYNLVGSSADITYTALSPSYLLTAQGGTYTLSGNSIDLRKSKRLTASGGGYSYTGQQVNITAGPAVVSTLVKYINVLTGEILLLQPF